MPRIQAHRGPARTAAGERRDRSEMREVIGLGQLRSDACTYLERVAAGETLDVIRRGKLVAQIVSVGDWRVAPVRARPVDVMAPDAGGFVGLDELRKRAGRCFDRVAAGETVEVIRSGKLVARIVSAARSDARSDLSAGASSRVMKIALPQPRESYESHDSAAEFTATGKVAAALPLTGAAYQRAPSHVALTSGQHTSKQP